MKQSHENRRELIRLSLNLIETEPEGCIQKLERVPSSESRLFARYLESLSGKDRHDFLASITPEECNVDALEVLQSEFSEKYRNHAGYDWNLLSFGMKKTIALSYLKGGFLPKHLASSLELLEESEIELAASAVWPSEKEIVGKLSECLDLKTIYTEDGITEYRIGLPVGGGKAETRVLISPSLQTVSYYHKLAGCSDLLTLLHRSGKWGMSNFDMLDKNTMDELPDLLSEILIEFEALLSSAS